MRTALLTVFLIAFVSSAALPQTPGAAVTERNYPAPVEGDFVIPNFHFRSGEVLPELVEGAGADDDGGDAGAVADPPPSSKANGLTPRCR